MIRAPSQVSFVSCTTLPLKVMTHHLMQAAVFSRTLESCNVRRSHSVNRVSRRVTSSQLFLQPSFIQKSFTETMLSFSQVTFTPGSCSLHPQSGPLATEQLHWSRSGWWALLKGTTVVVRMEGQALPFTFPTQIHSSGHNLATLTFSSPLPNC